MIAAQRQAFGNVSANDIRPWSDLCHVLVNAKEFTWLR